MTSNNAEYGPWPPASLLLDARKAVWEEYVGRVVLPSAAIWENMTTYLREQPPESFTLYKNELSKVRTQWNIEQTVRHDATDRAMMITAAVETETPLSKLYNPDEASAATVRLEKLDKWPDPDWPSRRRKYSIPADFLLADHPTFGHYITRNCNVLDVRLQARPLIERDRELLPGLVKKERTMRLALGNQFDTQPSKESPLFFRPEQGLRELKGELLRRAMADQLTLPLDDLEATRVATEQVLREVLPWRIGTGLMELEQIHLVLTGQLQEYSQI